MHPMKNANCSISRCSFYKRILAITDATSPLGSEWSGTADWDDPDMGASVKEDGLPFSHMLIIIKLQCLCCIQGEVLLQC